MELKVWCDGIQRVVCGVSSSTTCQDVVFALAHATAQTGRFILIEKWRNSERLLAPSEHPLQVLSKWGEYANDVTFVMRRSESHSKTNANANLNLSFSPQLSSSTSQSSSSATSPQHMLTTAAGGGGGGHTSSPNRKDFLNLFNTNSIYSSVNKKSSVFQQNTGSPTQSVAKQLIPNTTNPNNSSNSTPNVSPQKSNSSHNNTNSNNTNNKTAIDSIGCDLTPTKQQLNNKNNNTIDLMSTKNTAIGGNHRPRHPPPYSEAISKSAMITSAGQTNNSSSSHLLQQTTDVSSVTNKRRSAEPLPQNQKQRTGATGKDTLLHRDAIRLVDMQKDTMRTQEMEMSSLEQQISSIEKRLMDNEVLVKRYKDEMEACHQLWLDQEVTIDQMGDQQRLEQELDQLVATAQDYEEEMVTLKKKLSKCETDIGDCRQQISKLMDQLDDNQRLVRDMAINREEKDREMAEQMKTALRDKNQEFESQKSELQTLTNSIKHFDSVISEKNSEVDKLLADIKEANIQGLALQTADDKHMVTNNSGPPIHQRGGSTRRIIGSPRQLENAVATNKNPHGVWV